MSSHLESFLIKFKQKPCCFLCFDYQALRKSYIAMALMVSIPLVGIAALCAWLSLEKADYIIYKDPKQPTEARVEDLLHRMTLSEKIGQMTQIERLNATVEVMKDYHVGSLLSGGGSMPRVNATAEDWVDMINRLQEGSLSTRLGIPFIYGVDAVHGHNNVYKATIFPHNIGLGATRDPQLVKKIGAATALEVRATGIQYAYAPCIAVCRDPRWGRFYESYSEDHKIVQEMTELVIGLQEDIPPSYPKNYPYVGGKTKVVGCAKHYVGDGGTVEGIDEDNTVIDWEGLLKIHMPAYVDTIKKGVATVMVSYSSWNGKKMHANHELITNYLKGTLGFKGFVISDWQAIGRITSPPHKNYTYSVEASILAGIDMVMVPCDAAEFIKTLTSLVNKKVIPMSRIDDVVRRILRVKFIAGLFENPMADYSLANQIGSKDKEWQMFCLVIIYGFTGKLSRTWFKRVDQLPMNVGDRYYDPLFPFGFGLETRPRS